MKNLLLILIAILLSGLSFGQKQNADSNKKDAVITLYTKAEAIMYRDIDSAKTYAKQALKEAKNLKNSRLKAKSYIVLSNIYLRDNDVPRAFEYIELAEILGSEIEDEEVLAKSLFQKGTLFMVIGNEEKAITLLDQALDYGISIKDSTTISAIYNSMSLLYKRSGKMDKAVQMIHKAIDINKATKNKYSLAANMGNLSQYYSAQGDYESALTSINETLKICIELKSKNEIARSLVAIGEIYLQDHQYDSCTVYLNRAEELIEADNLLDPKLDLWAVKAAYEMSMHQYDKALQLFTLEYELAKDFEITELIKESIENMYLSAKASGRSALALEYLEEFKSLSDSLDKISGNEALVALELNEKFKHEQRLSEIEKDELKTKKENADLSASKKNYLILCLILASLLIGGIGLILVRKKQIALGKKENQKRELKDELELKNKELVSSAIQILRKSEEMKKTIESLEILNEKANPEDSQLLLSIIRKLKFELEHSTWEEFEVPFKQLHSRFYNDLIEKYPDLTRAEIKVCSLLKLNLDTKQISAILHKTSASIEVDRSRIRKKMGLTNTKTSLTRHISTNI